MAEQSVLVAPLAVETEHEDATVGPITEVFVGHIFTVVSDEQEMLGFVDKLDDMLDAYAHIWGISPSLIGHGNRRHTLDIVLLVVVHEHRQDFLPATVD